MVRVPNQLRAARRTSSRQRCRHKSIRAFLHLSHLRQRVPMSRYRVIRLPEKTKYLSGRHGSPDRGRPTKDVQYGSVQLPDMFHRMELMERRSPPLFIALMNRFTMRSWCMDLAMA